MLLVQIFQLVLQLFPSHLSQYQIIDFPLIYDGCCNIYFFFTQDEKAEEDEETPEAGDEKVK